MNAMANRIENDDKLRIDSESEKFKKVFEEEMSNNAQQAACLTHCGQ